MARRFDDLTPMTRILGLDYGTRRVGAALSDPGRSIATPLEVYERKAPGPTEGGGSLEADDHADRRLRLPRTSGRPDPERSGRARLRDHPQAREGRRAGRLGRGGRGRRRPGARVAGRPPRGRSGPLLR